FILHQQKEKAGDVGAPSEKEQMMVCNGALSTPPLPAVGDLLFATDQPLIAVMEITAAVVREKFGAFSIDRLELTDPRPDEALVRIVASGMCQTDLHGPDGYYNTPHPPASGHEAPG